MSNWTLTASKGVGEGGFEKAPPGNHPAVLVAVIDLGTQTIDGFQGAPAKDQHRAFFVWELVHEKKAGTNLNHVIAIDLTLSFNEKAKLRKWVEARTGKPIPDGQDFDVTKELGQSCLLNVIANNKGYPRIEGVSAVPKGMMVPAPQNKPIAISLAEFRDGAEIPGWIPYLYGQPISSVIRGCKEFQGTAHAMEQGPKPTQQVEQQPASTAVATAPPRRRPATSSSTRYYLDPGNGPLEGTFTLDEIQKMIESGKAISWPDPAICEVGKDDWTPLMDLPTYKTWIPF